LKNRYYQDGRALCSVNASGLVTFIQIAEMKGNRMAFNTEVSSEMNLNGEFQLAELEQRLEMASASSATLQPIYYCCFCVANCDPI
jgi:hypothetical protein